MNVALSQVEELFSIYSDLFKDCYGFRPRGGNLPNWSIDKWNQEIASLQREREEQIEQEQAAERINVKEFEKTISSLIASGANDRATAIRWMLDANENDCYYLCYRFGLPYGYLRQ
jgi:hypothetical protein